jgi:hypothetical protein
VRRAALLAAVAACGHTEAAPAVPASASVEAAPPASSAPVVTAMPPALEVPEASVPEASVPEAGPRHPKGKAPGSSCNTSAECGAGLACCQTGFSGHCGGVMPSQEELQKNPCVFHSTCTPGPCRPISLPP